jgi:hypothetical protein
MSAGLINLHQQTVPVNPAASTDILYFKAGDGLYSKNSAGTEVQYVTSGGLGLYVLKAGDTMTGDLNITGGYINFTLDGYGWFRDSNNTLVYSTYTEFQKKIINDDTAASTFAGDIRGEDFVKRRTQTATWAGGLLTQIAKTGGRTINYTYAAGILQSYTDGTNTWTISYNGDGTYHATTVT